MIGQFREIRPRFNKMGVSGNTAAIGLFWIYFFLFGRGNSPLLFCGPVFCFVMLQANNKKITKQKYNVNIYKIIL